MSVEAKGVGERTAAGLFSSITQQAGQLHPDIKTSPVVCLETDQRSVPVIALITGYISAIFSVSIMTLTSQIVQRFLAQALSWDSWPIRTTNFFLQYLHVNPGCWIYILL